MQDVIIATVRAIYRDTRWPVQSTAVAVRCCVSTRTAQRWLKELEEARQINRVGQRRGWLPANMN